MSRHDMPYTITLNAKDLLEDMARKIAEMDAEDQSYFLNLLCARLVTACETPYRTDCQVFEIGKRLTRQAIDLLRDMTKETIS